MHRSSSTSRFSDEFYPHSSSSPSPNLRTSTTTTDSDGLPIVNPDTPVAKKEKSRLRSAENAIHLIPLILVVCAIILWFFSKPAVDIIDKGDSNVPRIKGLMVNGDTDSDGTQSSLLPELELEDFNPKKVLRHKPRRLVKKKSV